MKTNPFGRSFLSYRRTAAADAQALITAQNVRGIPTWGDVDDLECEPTGDALSAELESKETANAVLWLTPDVAESAAIRLHEVPRILRRARGDDSFFVEARLSGALDWGDAAQVLEGVPTIESLSAGWNLSKAESPLTTEGARAVANAVLRRRVRAIAKSSSDALRLVLHTRADAPLAFDPEVAFQIDWRRSFMGRLARPGAWQADLLPALSDVVVALHREAAGRAVEATGLCCLPAAFALGRVFMEPSGINLTWMQHTPGGSQRWSLADEEEESGFHARTQHVSFDGTELAVLVNVRSDVEPAVHASGLPEFGAVTRIAPRDDAYPAHVASPGQATHLARLVVREIRRALTSHSHLRCAHVFLSGPAGLAVLIGQQLNALGPVQTYEHMPAGGPGRYEPAARLVDHLMEQAT